MNKGETIPIPDRHVTILGNSMASRLIVNNGDSFLIQFKDRLQSSYLLSGLSHSIQ